MQVGCRAAAHGWQVEALQEVEGLQQRRPLAPRPAAVDIVAAVRRVRRRLDFHRELGEVLGGENAALFLVERRNLLGKLPPVE